MEFYFFSKKYLFATIALKKQVLNKGSPKVFRFRSLGHLWNQKAMPPVSACHKSSAVRYHFHERQDKDPECSKYSQETKKTDSAATQQSSAAHQLSSSQAHTPGRPSQYLQLFHLDRKPCISTRPLGVWETHFWSLLVSFWISHVWMTSISRIG